MLHIFPGVVDFVSLDQSELEFMHIWLQTQISIWPEIIPRIKRTRNQSPHWYWYMLPGNKISIELNLQAAPNIWFDFHFQTCARLQAELQMAVDHLTIDPASYEQAEQDLSSMWQNQSKHVKFTDDTKNYSGKLETNPWAQTGKFFAGRHATGRPNVFQSYEDNDDDPALDALEDVSTAQPYQRCIISAS